MYVNKLCRFSVAYMLIRCNYWTMFSLGEGGERGNEKGWTTRKARIHSEFHIFDELNKVTSYLYYFSTNEEPDCLISVSCYSLLLTHVYEPPLPNPHSQGPTSRTPLMNPTVNDFFNVSCFPFDCNFHYIIILVTLIFLIALFWFCFSYTVSQNRESNNNLCYFVARQA